MNSVQNNFTFLAALAAAGYVVYQMSRATTQERAVDLSYVRMAEYRPASALCDNPALVVNLYRDGPLSWVAEDSSGRKWVAYGAGDQPPAYLRQRASLVTQI